MIKFSVLREQSEEIIPKEYHSTVIPLTGFSPISHMGHAKDLGEKMKSLPGTKHLGISNKSDLYSSEERSEILHRQWKQPNVQHHFVKSGGETIRKAFDSLPKNGKKVLHILVGHDRKDFAEGLKKSLELGKIKEMDTNKWDSIHIHHPDDTDRSHGLSGTNMRKAANENNLDEFHRHLGKDEFSKDEAKFHMKKFKDAIDNSSLKIKRGPAIKKIKEDTTYFKAIFVAGGPGSGKDIIIRALTEQNNSKELELNFLKNTFEKKLSLFENSHDERHIALQNKRFLIINSPADKLEDIFTIKEKLEDLFYKTMMIYVDTDDDISKERNARLLRPLEESIRVEKYKKSNQNIIEYYLKFDDFFLFKNNQPSYNLIEKYVEGAMEHAFEFLSRNHEKDFCLNWLNETVKNTSKLIVQPKQKNPSFCQDKETKKKDKYLNVQSVSKIIQAPGVGPTWDNRNVQGNIYPVSGLGNVLSQEEFRNNKYDKELNSKNTNFLSFKQKMKKEGIDSPQFVDGSEMGVGGTSGGSMNKEPLVTPIDQARNLDLGSIPKTKKKIGDTEKMKKIENFAKTFGISDSLLKATQDILNQPLIKEATGTMLGQKAEPDQSKPIDIESPFSPNYQSKLVNKGEKAGFNSKKVSTGTIYTKKMKEDIGGAGSASESSDLDSLDNYADDYEELNPLTDFVESLADDFYKVMKAKYPNLKPSTLDSRKKETAELIKKRMENPQPKRPIEQSKNPPGENTQGYGTGRYMGDSVEFGDLSPLISEVLNKASTASDFIHDFINSKNPKFDGKSKKERQKMALAAYYAKQKKEEAIDPKMAIEAGASTTNVLSIPDSLEEKETPEERKRKDAIFAAVKKRIDDSKYKPVPNDNPRFGKVKAHEYSWQNQKEEKNPMIDAAVGAEQPFVNNENPSSEPAKKKLAREEIETLDELSVSTLQSYKEKAQNRMMDHVRASLAAKTKEAGEAQAIASTKRFKGTLGAAARLARKNAPTFPTEPKPE